MNTNTQAVTQSQGGPNRSSSKIELLNAARIALEAEAEAEEIDNDAFCEEHAAIFDALSFERPKTAGEVGIMLHAAGFHMDMLSPLPTKSCHFAHGMRQASAGTMPYSVM